MTFSDRLTLAIDRSGKSQSQISREIGIRQTTISAFARGSQRPYLDQAAQLAHALQVSIDWLWHGEEREAAAAEGNPITKDELEILELVRALELPKYEAFRRLASHPSSGSSGAQSGAGASPPSGSEPDQIRRATS